MKNSIIKEIIKKEILNILKEEEVKGEAGQLFTLIKNLDPDNHQKFMTAYNKVKKGEALGTVDNQAFASILTSMIKSADGNLIINIAKQLNKVQGGESEKKP